MCNTIPNIVDTLVRDNKKIKITSLLVSLYYKQYLPMFSMNIRRDENKYSDNPGVKHSFSNHHRHCHYYYHSMKYQ